MDPNTKKLIFGFFFVVLGISLFIMSVLDIRSYQDTDNQTIKDSIDSINTFSHIMMVMAGFIVLTGIFFMIRSKRQDFLNFFFSLSARTESFIMITIGILILIVGIVQRTKINSILPDMSDENAVKSYNDHHTLPASSVLGSNMGIIIFGIIFLLAGIVHFFMNRQPDVEPQKIKSDAELEHEKSEAYVSRKKQEWEDAMESGKYSDDKLDQMKLIYLNADAATKKAWSEYENSKLSSLAQSQSVQQSVEASKVKTSLSTPVSAKASAPKPLIQGGLWGQP